MAEQYTCAACGNTYEEGWSDEEARAEYAEVFPGCSIVTRLTLFATPAIRKWCRSRSPSLSKLCLARIFHANPLNRNVSIKTLNGGPHWLTRSVSRENCC